MRKTGWVADPDIASNFFIQTRCKNNSQTFSWTKNIPPTLNKQLNVLCTSIILIVQLIMTFDYKRNLVVAIESWSYFFDQILFGQKRTQLFTDNMNFT